MWLRVGLDNPDGNHALIAQVRKPSMQGGVIITMDTIAPIAVVQKIVKPLFVEVCDREGLSLEPAAEVGEQAHGILRRPARIALRPQLLSKGVDIRTQRTGVQLLQHKRIGTKWRTHTCLLCGGSVDHTEKTSRIMRRNQVSG